MTIDSFDTKSVFSRRDFLKLFAITTGVSFLAWQSFQNARTEAKGAFISVIKKPTNAWVLPIKKISYPSETKSITGMPGSLMKLVATAILLENHNIQVNTKYDCRGLTNAKLTNGQSLHCSHAHGNVSLIEALAVSCNGYFANAIQSITPEEFQIMWHYFFPNRTLKILPTRTTLPNYLLGSSKEVTLNAFDLLQWMRMIATKGKYHPPNSAGLRPYTWHILHQGMRSAARWGTGKKTDPNDKYQLALKTGTTKHGNTYQSWVAGFFPFDNPTRVFCCRGTHGTSEESAIPSLRNTLSYYDAIHT